MRTCKKNEQLLKRIIEVKRIIAAPESGFKAMLAEAQH